MSDSTKRTGADFDEPGFRLLQKVAQEACTSLSAKIGVKIYIDAGTLRECHLSALVSKGFHGKSSTPNHIKYSAHVAFWIMKLKPCSSAIRILESVAKVSGFDKIVDKFIDSDYSQRRKAAEDFLVNEYLSILVAARFIEYGYIDIVNQLEIKEMIEEVKDLRAQLEAANDRFARCSGDLALSLREHNYSSRAMATMFELAFTTGYER